jgi:hypothetical protein
MDDYHINLEEEKYGESNKNDQKNEIEPRVYELLLRSKTQMTRATLRLIPTKIQASRKMKALGSKVGAAGFAVLPLLSSSLRSLRGKCWRESSWPSFPSNPPSWSR